MSRKRTGVYIYNVYEPKGTQFQIILKFNILPSSMLKYENNGFDHIMNDKVLPYYDMF